MASSTTSDATSGATSGVTGSASSTLSSIASTIVSSTLSASASFTSDVTPTASSTSEATATATQTSGAPNGQDKEGQGIVSFISALAVAISIFAAQILLFLLLRNKLARIFKPKTYLVPERERTEPPPRSLFGMFKTLMKFSDREIINKCGLDAFFFLRYLKTLLVIFVPICIIVMPILVPLNYVGGRGHNLDVKDDDDGKNSSTVTGLDTLAWGNIKATNTHRYGAHLLMAILVVIWVCTVFFFELRVYIKVRQDYLTSAEHRLRASATTVLVNSIPQKWLSEDALQGLFDVFPGGVRNIWLNRDLSTLLEKVSLRDSIHLQLESAETELIRAAKKKQLKKKAAEDKQRRKSLHLGALSKQEKAALDAQEDEAALRRANAGGGTHAGDVEHVPHTVDAGVRESETETLQHDRALQNERQHKPKGFGLPIPLIGDPLAKVAQGIKDVVEKAGNEVDETLETTNGFMGLTHTTDHARPASRASDRRIVRIATNAEDTPRPSASDTLHHNNTHSRSASALSGDSTRQIRLERASQDVRPTGNTVRKLENEEDLFVKEETKWWQFWKPPSGSYTSPVPQGDAAQAYMQKKANDNTSIWAKIKRHIPFIGSDKEDEYEYSQAFNPDYKEDQEPAAWEQYLKKKDRPTHRLPLFGVTWLFGIPFVTKKVDTIYWCREELARLNLEIEEDQKHPERFPLMNSAFIQFNHQVAAHMACQSAIHHVPQQMAPRMNEISPRDVIWDNMAFTWWQEWARTAIVVGVVCGMIILWSIPVAWTAALSQINVLTEQFHWLRWINDNGPIENTAKAIAGVLPAVVLGLLLFLIPLILDFLAGIKGAKTGAQKIEFVQIFYFVFLFVQVFLIVSIASFFAASVDKLVDNIKELQTVNDVLDLLATNLPKASNYFFSYMILQALSTSSGTLLQIGALIMWYVIARLLDSTARNKWTRNTKLNQVRWGAFFPVYTNFACIALVYCVISPIISIFAIITFGLLWVAQRYAMLYVTRFEHDTGGVLYPRAINQTFTGLYVMELCMAGLFFIVEDDQGRNTCTTHGTIMLVVLVLTVLYQFLLNWSFSPLFRFLPITFEDEAVLRDEAFQRAQDRRLGLIDDEIEDEAEGAIAAEKKGKPEKDIEMRKMNSVRSRNPVRQVGTWAKDGGTQLKKLAMKPRDARAAEYRQQQRRKDLEAQRAIGDALYGGFHDEIEDLTPEERDALTRHAFQHSALRSRRPIVWIPRDDLGISDDEIRRTKEYSDNIWISNEGTALDSKVRVVYGKNPPDFSEVDLIEL